MTASNLDPLLGTQVGSYRLSHKYDMGIIELDDSCGMHGAPR